MSYIGNEPTSVAFLTDSFSGNGSTTAFTMTVAPATTSSILVAITGVVQDPSTYSVSGTTLTFSAAPPTGTGNISVRYLGIPASGVATTAYRTVTEFTATAGQTTFSVPSYTVGYINVYMNGVMLGSADYTATNGTTVVLAAGAVAGSLITTESFYVSSVLNAIPATAGSVGSSYIANDAVGAAQIAAGAVGTSELADANVTQAKLGTNVAGNGPAFSAYPAADTSISNATSTVVANSTEEFDTAGCYNNTGSTVGGIPAYSFLPNVAGYYLFTATCDDEQSTAAVSRFILTIDKNGTGYRVADNMSTSTAVISGSILMYMNGTTDSVRMSVYIASTGAKYGGSLSVTRFSGYMVRAA